MNKIVRSWGAGSLALCLLCVVAPASGMQFLLDTVYGMGSYVGSWVTTASDMKQLAAVTAELGDFYGSKGTVKTFEKLKDDYAHLCDIFKKIDDQKYPAEVFTDDECDSFVEALILLEWLAGQVRIAFEAKGMVAIGEYFALKKHAEPSKYKDLILAENSIRNALAVNPDEVTVVPNLDIYKERLKEAWNDYKLKVQVYVGQNRKENEQVYFRHERNQMICSKKYHDLSQWKLGEFDKRKLQLGQESPKKKMA